MGKIAHIHDVGDLLDFFRSALFHESAVVAKGEDVQQGVHMGG